MCKRVMEAENSIVLTIYSSVNIFITLGWCSENDYGFTYEYTYQDYEYSNIQLVTKPAARHVIFLLQAASAIAFCRTERICVQVA